MKIYLPRVCDAIRQFAVKVSLLMHICDHAKCMPYTSISEEAAAHEAKDYKMTQKRKETRDTCNTRTP